MNLTSLVQTVTAEDDALSPSQRMAAMKELTTLNLVVLLTKLNVLVCIVFFKGGTTGK